MSCELCNDRGWLLVCQNCGNEASISFAGDDIMEFCPKCMEKGLDYSITQIPCDNCQAGDENKTSSFKLSCELVIKEFSKEYGEKKVRKIRDEIAESSKIKRAIEDLEKRRTIPSIDAIIALIGSHMFFMFGPKRNIALASCVFLYLWNQRCNSDYELRSEEEMVNMLEILLKKTSKML